MCRGGGGIYSGGGGGATALSPSGPTAHGLPVLLAVSGRVCIETTTCSPVGSSCREPEALTLLQGTFTEHPGDKVERSEVN